jgi:hypothetical protein
MAEQLTLVAAALLGFVGAPWPYMIVPAAVLLAMAADRIVAASRRYTELGIARVFAISIPAIAAHALLFAALAFGLGRVLALLIAWQF